MRTTNAKITSQGQVTIPVEVRRYLGLEKGKGVSFVIAEDGVRLEPARFSSIEDVFGSVPGKPGMPEDFDEEIDEAMSDEADRRMRGWFGHDRHCHHPGRRGSRHCSGSADDGDGAGLLPAGRRRDGGIHDH